ncbi:BlaI/MecI/CopY family transcriptional regulator [Alkalihalobacillus hwajinpoensis]|uniref:BlaI/MecI/CopY family transcriptional regulator n=1 Tax=Guptibacillus hwajinpoensis TaxID=208199 RepID=UPI0018837C18|nr:BlaI/MecI/CopY family transcriptional regulator [Pseudalkalibacillus hwajinpoensis]MBF0705323.1 BlaI/MecI/CopY family transcriptional regulator [Pseudalkalibacillus hwajinpoensis]
MKIHQFKTNETGLNRFFGSLEAKVMDILFEGPEMTIKDVKQKLDQEKSTNFNTVMTVMNRLVDKGILVKRVEKRTSMFKPLLSKEDFLQTQSKELTQDLMDEFGPLAVNHMLDALDEADPVLIEKLEQKIKQLKEK